MNNYINDIAEKAQDDADSTQKILDHFNKIIISFTDAQNMIMDRIKSLNTNQVGVRATKNKAIVACQGFYTDACKEIGIKPENENSAANFYGGSELI